VATKPVLDLCSETNGKFSCDGMIKIGDEVKNAAQKIIEAKKSTYYGIGMALVRITKAILGNENSVLTVSTMLSGEYGCDDVYAGVPSIVNQNGIESIITLSLTKEELKKFQDSCDILKNVYSGIKFD